MKGILGRWNDYSKEITGSSKPTKKVIKLMHQALAKVPSVQVKCCIVPLLGMPKGTSNETVEDVEFATICLAKVGNAGDAVIIIAWFYAHAMFL